jgi:drug/metabolite transporter (DMT)-like permease
MTAPHEKLGLAFGIIGTCLFGATLPATRLAVDFFNPLFVSASRAVVAGCLGVFVLLVMRRQRPSRRMIAELIAAGLCTIIGYPIFIALALQTVPASHGGVVLGIMPLATMAFAALLLRERPTLGFWLASAAGSLLVIWFVVRHNEGTTISHGDLFLLGAVVTGALGYTLSGRLSAQRPGWEVISWQVAMFLPFTAAATFFLWPVNIADAPASAWAGLAYVATVSMYLAFFVFNAAMALAGVARVGQLTLLQPFVIVALSIPVNGEKFAPETLLFAAAVVVTVVVGQRMGVRRRKV